MQNKHQQSFPFLFKFIPQIFEYYVGSLGTYKSFIFQLRPGLVLHKMFFMSRINSLGYYLLSFFLLQAFNYEGENLLSQDKCGEAIRSLKESQKCEYYSNTSSNMIFHIMMFLACTSSTAVYLLL